MRQIASMLVLVALGISLLGGGYLSILETRLNNQMESLQGEVADTILVSVPVFSDDELASDDDSIEFEKLFSKYRFSRGFEDDGTKHEFFAYVETVGSSKIRWQSKFPGVRPDSDGKLPFSLKSIIQQFNIDKDEDRIKPSFTSRNLPRIKEGETNLLKFIVYSEQVVIGEGRERVRVVVARSAKEVNDDSDHVQKNVIALFFCTLALVLVAQLISNYFIITPIRDFEAEVRQIEAGAQKAIEKAYPIELMEVKSAINTLINVEKGQKQRYRESLEDLAHSLKTPLSALLATAQSKYHMKDDEQKDLVNEIRHMSDIVAYQLKRAAVRAPNSMIELVPLRPVLVRLRKSLHKVYHDKNFEIIINVDEFDKVRLESDDLIELFGNLINNACRFCNEVIEVTATSETNFLVVDIDDDGMGFGVDKPSELLKRGMRNDSKTEGQGIGLAISADIVKAVGGKIELKASPQVGARVRLYLPH